MHSASDTTGSIRMAAATAITMVTIAISDFIHSRVEDWVGAVFRGMSIIGPIGLLLTTI